MKKYVLILIFSIFATAITLTGYFLMISNDRGTHIIKAQNNTFTTPLEKKQEESGNTLGATEIKYNPINICYSSECIRISGSTVAWFRKDSDRTQIRVSHYVGATVKPFFEEKFVKKAVVSNMAGSFGYIETEAVPNLDTIEKLLMEKVRKAVPNGNLVKIQIARMEVPGTDGKYAKKYIEVDNSRQKLYAWMNGKIDKVINLSGPKYGYQVYGVFPITHKGTMPVSPGGKYMPYWMSFYYSPSQKSRYGLHGLVWWYDDKNNKIFEPLTNIGIRRSAGCIRMVLSDAKYLYSVYDVGDKVLIHE